MSIQLPEVKGFLPMPAVKPAADCRQRLAAEGKSYPKSNCAVCGQFSPRWKECDAALASPVPPAGDVEVHHQYLCKGLYERWMPLQESELEDAKREGFQVRELVDRAHVARMSAERDGLLARLATAEDAATKGTEARQVAGGMQMTIDDLQSELTKARELLKGAFELACRGTAIPSYFIDDMDKFFREHQSLSAASITHNADKSCGKDAEAAKGGV